MTRARMLAVAFTLGALAMSATVEDATAQEKKSPEVLKQGTRVWNEKVTVKRWDKYGKKFLNPIPGVWAERRDTKKGLMFDVRSVADNTNPVTGSVIIDKDGNEYTVIEAEAPPSGLFVKLTKAAPKKKP